MKTDTSDVDPAGTEPRLPASTVFELLLNERRRYALYYLSQKVGAVSLAELADAIALREGVRTDTHLERICAGLHHKHLPKLAEERIIRYDQYTETVELTNRAHQLEPYLDLAIVDDL